MSGFPVFPREVKGVHATVDAFAGIWRTHRLGEADRAPSSSSKDSDPPFSFQVGLSPSTRGIDDEYLPDLPPSGTTDADGDVRCSKFAFGSGLDVLKGRFQVSGGSLGAREAKGQWTGKVQSGRLLFKWNAPDGEQDHGTGTMKLVSKDEAIVLGFPCADYNAPGEEMGVRLYRMRMGPVGSEDVNRDRLAGSHGAASFGAASAAGENNFPATIASSIVSGIGTVASLASSSIASAAARASASVSAHDEGHHDVEEGEAGDGDAREKATRGVKSRLGVQKALAWLPTKDRILGQGKLREMYDDVSGVVDRAYVAARMHWISIDPVLRRRILAVLAFAFCVVAATQIVPALGSFAESSFGESLGDFFNAPRPAYPTTDKLWRPGIKRNKAQGGGAPCRDNLIAAQHGVWLHNTCHFQEPPTSVEATPFTPPSIIGIALDEYIAIRRTQDKERKQANTFWVFDVGGGDVRSTHRILDALESKAANGILQQQEFRVVAFEPDPDAFKAAFAYQQKHPNLFMQQAVVSDFSGPAKVYMVDRKSAFSEKSTLTDPSAVDADERITSVEQAVAVSLDDAVDRAVLHEDDIPLVYVGSGGHELTIMRGLARQLERKRIHTLLWEHTNIKGARPGDKPSSENLNVDAGYESVSRLEAEVAFVSKMGYRVYAVGTNKQLGQPHLVRVDGEFWTPLLFNAMGCANLAEMLMMAVPEGHPTMDEHVVKPMLTCVPPAPLEGNPTPSASAGSFGGGFGRRLLQTQPFLPRPEMTPGSCVCMPPMTLDCGSEVPSTCANPQVLQQAKRLFQQQQPFVQGGGAGAAMGTNVGGQMQGGVGQQQQWMAGAGVMQQQPMQQPMYGK